MQDLKKAIREDARYAKFSSSEKKCEKEFVAWLKDKTMQARDDYRQLLQVQESRTHIELGFHQCCESGPSPRCGCKHHTILVLHSGFSFFITLIRALL